MKMDEQAVAKALSGLRGRRPWSEREGRFVVDTWKASGESVPTFARRIGFVPQRVYWWMSRLGRGGAGRHALAVSPPASAFVPVTVRSEAATTTSTAVTVVASDGLRIEVAELDGTSAAWVAMLVKTLREVRP